MTVQGVNCLNSEIVSGSNHNIHYLVAIYLNHELSRVMGHQCDRVDYGL
jgi:hypothetical protein